MTNLNNTNDNNTNTDAKASQASIIQKLLEEKQSNQAKVTKLSSLNSGGGRSLSAHQVESMRNKIFSLVLVVLIVILWVTWVWPSFTSYIDERKAMTTERDTLDRITTQLEDTRIFEQYASIIDDESTDLIDCINSGISCDILETALVPFEADTDARAKQVQYYLQIGDLTDPKLLVDERSLLTNIDLFLLRFANGESRRSPLGEILSLQIGEPSVVDGKMYEVSVELMINFPNDEALITFLNNAENHIITNDTIDLPPILYKVEEVGYDIASFEEAQDTTINMIAYYYSEE